MPKYTELKERRVSYKFEDFASIGEFVETIGSRSLNKHFVEYGKTFDRHSSVKGDFEFTKTESYEQAQEYLVNGYAPIAKRLAEKVPVSTNTAATQRSKTFYDVVGYTPSVPRYLIGVPDNMLNRKNVQQKNKIITVNRDICYSASVRSSKIEEEGIKALQIISNLENRGYRVKLNLFFSTLRDNEIITVRICVKRPEERFSLLKVAYPLAHPGFLRRQIFRYVESCPHAEKSFVGGYGTPVGNEAINKIAGAQEITIPNFINNVNDYIKELKIK